MTKRASLVGRGVEILFGEEQENSKQGTSSSAESPPTESPFPISDVEEPLEVEAASDLGEPLEEMPVVDAEEAMAAEWEAAMMEEAASATTGEEPISEPDVVFTVDDAESIEEVEPLETPEADVEFTAENGRPDWPAVQVEEPVAEDLGPLATEPAQPEEALPVAEEATPSEVPVMEPVEEAVPETYAPAEAVPAMDYEPEMPPAPTYTETYAPPEEPPASLPPPKEKPEAAEPIRRIRVESALYQTVKPTEEQLAPSDGFEGGEFIPEEVKDYDKDQPSRVRRDREILEQLGLKQRQALWDEISKLYKVVPEVLCTDKQQGDALRLLQQAQDILLEKPRQFDVAQFKVGQVQSLIKRRTITSRWANTYGWAAFVYLVICFMLLIVAFAFSPTIASQVAAVQTKVVTVLWLTDGVLFGLLSAMIWGSLGGVLGSFYSLYWHAAKKKDFDKQYMMWYIIQPVIGLPIGALIYAIIGSGFITAVGETAAGEEVSVPLFAYVVALIAGFRQRFILELVDRIIQLLTSPFEQNSGGSSEPAIPGESVPPPTGG